MSITITELARHLGVSAMTVSRAMRGTGRISPETRERVMNAARTLGCRPNNSARSMRTGRSGCIALLLGTEAEQSVLPQGLLWGIHDALEKHGLYLIVARLPDEKLSADGFIPNILSQWMADGILVNYTHRIPRNMTEQIHRYDAPSIWINAKLPQNCIYPADFKAAREATEQLLREGRRRIVYANFYEALQTDMKHVHYSYAERFGGYEKAMLAAGLRSIRLSGPGSDDLANFSRQWLNANRDVDAFITFNSFTAAPLAYAAATTKRLAQKNIAIVTFDGAPFYDRGLGVSTIVIPEREIGVRAVELLLECTRKGIRKLKPVSIPLVPNLCNPCRSRFI